MEPLDIVGMVILIIIISIVLSDELKYRVKNKPRIEMGRKMLRPVPKWSLRLLGLTCVIHALSLILFGYSPLVINIDTGGGVAVLRIILIALLHIALTIAWLFNEIWHNPEIKR